MLRFAFVAMLAFAAPAFANESHKEAENAGKKLEEASQSIELSAEEKNLVIALRELPPHVRQSLLFGWNLNVQTLLIFSGYGRDKTYLFDSEKQPLRRFLGQNLEATLKRLEECPESEFAGK